MKIIYLTTAINKDDFSTFSKMWRIALNPSNQNFHNKVIRSLAITHKVDVISLRPFSLSNCKAFGLKEETKEEGNITWHYLKTFPFKLLRGHVFEKEAKKLLKKLDLNDAIIITDTINPTCLKLANILKKHFNLPVIGTVTDSPSNISGTGRSYTLFLLKESEGLNGFISLTEDLNFMYNQYGKPFYIFEGIVEDSIEKKPTEYGNYFFFGGALMSKYGIYNLIEAFKKLNRNDINLIICGHHCDNKTFTEAIKGHENIKYLRLLPVDKVTNLEANAIACINPRPYTEDLDRYSIPSKTLEYLSSGSITISVRNSKLQPIFMDSAIWADSHSADDLYKCMKKVLSMTDNERQIMARNAKEKTTEHYSLSSVNNKLIGFLSQFIRK